jgi:hypothetical protein
MNMEQRWSDDYQGKLKNSEKNLFDETSSTTDRRTQSDPGKNPAL